ncbi:hypothetical protein J6590_043419 [Homalodisca vitripennis]|nr:hypothetical protein J6590_043419 [Homalodisca vitripennis]
MHVRTEQTARPAPISAGAVFTPATPAPVRSSYITCLGTWKVKSQGGCFSLITFSSDFINAEMKEAMAPPKCVNYRSSGATTGDVSWMIEWPRLYRAASTIKHCHVYGNGCIVYRLLPLVPLLAVTALLSLLKVVLLGAPWQLTTSLSTTVFTSAVQESSRIQILILL